MDEELSQALTELVQEITAQRKEEREKKNKPEDKRFLARTWGWISANVNSLSTLASVLAVVLGALWAIYQFNVQQQQRLEQQQREELFRQQERVIAAIDDLNDPAKRNTAAYALAILAEEEALPLLLSQWRETIGSQEDNAFREALAQSLILIGEPALAQVLDANRQAGVHLGSVQNRAVVTATQSVILHYLTLDKGPLSAGMYDLTDVVIMETDLSYRDLSGLSLAGIRLLRNHFCEANFDNTNLADATFSGSQLGRSTFDGADVSRIDFSNASFTGSASFQEATVSGANFERVRLDGADFHKAILAGARFNWATLRFGRFESAQLSGADFSYSNLYQAQFVNAELESVNFTGAYLQDADFSGANLKGVRFFTTAGPFARPHILQSLRTEDNEAWDSGTGAIVDGANFDGAQNIDEDTRVYLCRWGATNVPGGCDGIAQEEFSYEINSNPSGSASSCF